MTDQGGDASDGVAANQTPPGWYPDGTGNQRWWDGQQWADHVAPMTAPASTTDPKTVASLMHASGIFFGFIGPLVGYLVYPQDQFIRKHSRNALNFQLTVLIGYLVSFVLMIVIIGFFTMIAIMVVAVIFHIIAAMEASKGNHYKYPLTIEFLKS